MKHRNSSKQSGPCVEGLEQRALLAATPGHFVVAFYGAGGPGGFGNDWLDNIADKAGDRTDSTVRKYTEDQGGRALKDLFRSIDTNHNFRIDKREVAVVSLRVIGYSLGAIQAANFSRDLLKVGQNLKGYTLGVGVPVRGLVTLDPVNTDFKHTNGASNNVARFGNYYQLKGGDTKVDLYTQGPISVKVRTITVDDPGNIVGGTLTSHARRSRQIRIDSGPYADETVKHEVFSGLDGKLKGRNVNHGTLPFFVYDLALEDLTT